MSTQKMKLTPVHWPLLFALLLWSSLNAAPQSDSPEKVKPASSSKHQTSEISSPPKSDLDKVEKDIPQATVSSVANLLKRKSAGFHPFQFDFELEDIGGEVLSKKSFAGKVLIVNLFTSNSASCRREISHLIRLQAKYPDTLAVFGIAFERTHDSEFAVDRVFEMGEELEINFDCAIGDVHVRSQVPRLSDYPATLFIDREGKLRMLMMGEQGFEKIDMAAQTLLVPSR